MEQTAAAIRFHPGHTYFGRSICNHDHVYRMKVLRRTAKTIAVAMDDRPEVKTLRPHVYQGVESVMPHGRYSMALVISADREET